MSQFCKYCGNELKDGTVFCGSCGASVQTGTSNSQPQTINENVKEKKKYNVFSCVGFGLSILALFIPPLYFDTVMLVSAAAITLGIIGLVKNQNYEPNRINKIFAIIAICAGAYSAIYTISEWEDVLSIFN